MNALRPIIRNMKKRHMIPRLIAPLYLLLMLASCGEEKQQQTASKEEKHPLPEISDADLEQADEMIKSMPSPIEMAILIKHAGGEYNPELLNDIKNLEKYITTGKKTMNMGVYSADVGYTSLYKQTQETVFYLNNVRKLSDAIGLSDAFSQSMFDRVEANIEDRDSLLHILSTSYDLANQYLKENDRMNISVLMLAGGWVESMYLASNLGVGDNQPEDVIALRLLEQEPVLDKIIQTMEMHQNDPLVDEFADRLRKLEDVLIIDQLRIGSGEKASVDQEKMQEVYRIINDLRGWVVS